MRGRRVRDTVAPADFALLLADAGFKVVGLDADPRPVRTADGVELEVYSPQRLRSGLFFMSRFTIRAEREIEFADLYARHDRILREAVSNDNALSDRPRD